MDAAIAASAVLGVVEPMSTGIGGDAFCLYAPAGAEQPVAFNGSGRAPGRISPERLLSNGMLEITPESPHAVTIPGAVDAYCRLLHDHGRLDIAEVLEPAIKCAEEGFAVTPVIARAWAGSTQRLQADAGAKSIFLRDGTAPNAGDMHSQPELAATLREIASKGKVGFYEGRVAEELVECLATRGGMHSLEDFANAAGEYVSPVSTTLAGYQVFECPPNGQGIIALLMLNILTGFDLSEMDPLGADRLHLTLEAGRFAFRDRELYLADPDHAEVPTSALLSEDYAARIRERISLGRAVGSLPDTSLPVHRDTVYISVVDQERNAASFISSLYYAFGSSIVAPQSGVALHCRGVGFVLKPGHRNCLAPGKRPMHTIIPGMLYREGRAVMPFGVMGADYQPWGHVQLLHNLLLYGMNPQEALDLPRFTHDGGVAIVEDGVPDAVAIELARRGHTVATAVEPLGGGQAILIDWERGTLAGGSEPRKDGIALGY